MSTREIIQHDGFHISYNPFTDCGEETALCCDGEYFIVLGDARKYYEGVKSFNEAYLIFLGLLRKGFQKSSWSN